MNEPGSKRFLGMVVNPIYVQEEGLNQVFDNIESAGTTAIGLWPSMIEPANEGSGGRMPDLHIDGYKRVLDRPLWGKRALQVRSYPTFQANEELYTESGYRPPAAPPKSVDSTIPRQMFDEARRRGMAVHLGIGPFLPPDVREEDRPRIVDGSTLKPPVVARHACLNSANARRYALAAISDLANHYPHADGLILDWVEFGAYKLEEHFTCFCGHCATRAAEMGFDWPRIRHDVQRLWRQLHRLTASDLRYAEALATNPPAVLELLGNAPGWLQFLQFKAGSVLSVYEEVRQQLDRLGYTHMGLTARGWCPPWNRSSGSDYRRLAGICSAVSPKLFTFDHAVLPRWAAETVQEWNPQLGEAEILEAMLSVMNLPDDRRHRTFADYQIPGPEEAHPTRFSSYGQRLRELLAQVGDTAPCYPIAHPYLPLEQWAEMVTLIRDSGVPGMWVNMYGYLSGAKLEILRRNYC